MPRNTPGVHCVVRSRTKLTRMRGENCVEASVSVISRMAKTMDTTVMMEAAMPPKMTCAICGSWCDGNSVPGSQAAMAGTASSSDDSTAPAVPSSSAMTSGRTRNPPRNAYIRERNIKGNDWRMPNRPGNRISAQCQDCHCVEHGDEAFRSGCTCCRVPRDGMCRALGRQAVGPHDSRRTAAEPIVRCTR